MRTRNNLKKVKLYHKREREREREGERESKREESQRNCDLTLKRGRKRQ